jgi:hypothetical protein
MATKAKRAKRKSVKSGGEAPCKICKPIRFAPARKRDGTFKKKPKR